MSDVTEAEPKREIKQHKISEVNRTERRAHEFRETPHDEDPDLIKLTCKCSKRWSIHAQAEVLEQRKREHLAAATGRVLADTTPDPANYSGFSAPRL